MNVKLKEVLEKMDKNEQRIKMSVKAVEENVVANGKLVQVQLPVDNLETKKYLNKLKQQLENLTQQASHQFSAAQERENKEMAEADRMDKEPKIVVAGGWNGKICLNSVGMFSLSNAV